MNNSATNPSQAPSSRKMKRLALLVVAPALAAIIGIYIYLQGGRYIETDNAYIKAEKIPVSSEVSGNIVEVFVKDNENVKSGQPLFRLDASHFEIAVTRAQAKLDQASSDIASLKASYVAKQAEIRLARANHDYALKEQQRLTGNGVSNYVSKVKQDALVHDTEINWQKITLLEDELQQIVAAGGDNDSPIEQHPLYMAAFAELAQSRLDLEHTLVKASRAGTISKPPKVGQFVATGNAATILVADDSLWIEANLTETDLTYVHEGQDVKIEVDAYPEHHWHGVVESISPATGAEFSVIPAQNATGNWVKIAQRLTVRIRILPQPDAPALRSGLSSNIRIDTGHQRRLSELRLTL